MFVMFDFHRHRKSKKMKNTMKKSLRQKKVGTIDPQTVYVHNLIYALKNSRKTHAK